MNVHEQFKIRSYGYGELALLYFPSCNKNSASAQHGRWIWQNENLKKTVNGIGV
jgi:hypothetical protein